MERVYLCVFMYMHKYTYGRKTKYLEDLTVYLLFSSILSQPPSQVTWPLTKVIFTKWPSGARVGLRPRSVSFRSGPLLILQRDHATGQSQCCNEQYEERSL